jgi:hypothetical protein
MAKPGQDEKEGPRNKIWKRHTTFPRAVFIPEIPTIINLKWN